MRDMLRRGVHPNVIMSITGHTSLSILKRYDIIDERDQPAALRLMHAYRQEQDAVEGMPVN